MIKKKLNTKERLILELKPRTFQEMWVKGAIEKGGKILCPLRKKHPDPEETHQIVSTIYIKKNTEQILSDEHYNHYI